MRRWRIDAGLIAIGCAFVVGLAAGILDSNTPTVDIEYFAQRGELLLSAAWASTFADPTLQAGPVQVGVLAVIVKAGTSLGASTGLVLSLATEVSVTVLLAVITGSVLADRPSRTRVRAQLLVVAAAVATGMVHRCYVDGHPAQVVIPLLWMAAGLRARSGRSGSAGILIAVTAGLETWGMLGTPLLLLCPRRRDVVYGFAAQAAGVVALYGPFILAGNFRMFEYAWSVVGGTPVSLILSPGEPFTWWLRLLQGAVALTVGAAVAMKLRHSIAAVWAVPLTVILTRLIFEPNLNEWYFIAVETAALVGAADLASGRASSLWAAAKLDKPVASPPLRPPPIRRS